MPNKKAIIETNKGTITVELYEDKAPITAGNFIDLVGRGFYDGLTFHRYEPGFVIQGGDPIGNGTGGFVDPQSGRERRIKLEVSPELKHGEAGALAMARSQNPNSANSQFFICFADARFLDKQYTVWGKVVEGMENVDKIKRGEPVANPDKIVSMKVAADA